MSEKDLQTAEERREAKSKEEREKYTQLNAEFQRVVRRDKEAFLSEQCEEVQETNRMGSTRNLSKKIGDIKGTFHAGMGRIKGRNCKDLAEAEEVARMHRNTIF